MLVEQASTTTVTVTYASGSTGADILTITHATQASGYEMRDVIQNALISAHDKKTSPDVIIEVTPTKAVSGIAIA